MKFLTFGCSYTDEKYVELVSKDNNIKDHLIDNEGNFTKPFPFWPQMLAKKLDMKLFNYAQCGFGNDGIHSTFVDEISNKNDIGLVVIMWSEFLRIGYEVEKRSPFNFNQKFEWFKINLGAGDKNPEFRGKQIEVNNTFNKYGLLSPGSLLKKSLRYFYSVQNICENLNIPFIQIMGMPPCKIEMENEFCRSIIKSPLFDKFNKDTFIGWPIFPEIEGFSCGSKLYEIDANREKYFINYNNVHPNLDGQKFIFNMLYEKVKENVNTSITRKK